MADLRLGYLNSVVLMGRAAADPDIRYTPKGTPVCTFRLAVNRRYLDKNTNEWKDETYFFNVNAWFQLAERLAERMKKGSALLIEGELRSRTWDAPTGEKRSAFEIYARRVQILDKVGAAEEAQPAETVPEPPIDEEPDIPKDQLDDIPF
ncbi:MAG: single-stranded DNA-binding protein [candidate division WOR-3 bacterium]